MTFFIAQMLEDKAYLDFLFIFFGIKARLDLLNSLIAFFCKLSVVGYDNKPLF
jgi:hypothetical protein